MLTNLKNVNTIMIPIKTLQSRLPSPAMVPKDWAIMIIDLKDCFFTIPLMSIHISTGSPQRAEPEASVQSTSSSPHSIPMDLKAWGWLASGQGREEELTVARGGGEKRQAGSQGSFRSQCFGGMQKFQRPTSLRDDMAAGCKHQA